MVISLKDMHSPMANSTQLRMMVMNAWSGETTLATRPPDPAHTTAGMKGISQAASAPGSQSAWRGVQCSSQERRLPVIVSKLPSKRLLNSSSGIPNTHSTCAVHAVLRSSWLPQSWAQLAAHREEHIDPPERPAQCDCPASVLGRGRQHCGIDQGRQSHGYCALLSNMQCISLDCSRPSGTALQQLTTNRELDLCSRVRFSAQG